MSGSLPRVLACLPARRALDPLIGLPPTGAGRTNGPKSLLTGPAAQAIPMASPPARMCSCRQAGGRHDSVHKSHHWGTTNGPARPVGTKGLAACTREPSNAAYAPHPRAARHRRLIHCLLFLPHYACLIS